MNRRKHTKRLMASRLSQIRWIKQATWKWFELPPVRISSYRARWLQEIAK